MSSISPPHILQPYHRAHNRDPVAILLKRGDVVKACPVLGGYGSRGGGACGQTLRTFKDRNITRSGRLDTNIKLLIDIAPLKGK